MINNITILEAVERLRDEWPELWGEDAEKLAHWLATTPGDDPEAIRQTTNRILNLLRAHPQAQTRLGGALGIKGDLTRLLYEPPAGGPGEIPAGTLMVCPLDPAHYRRRLRQKGQPLFCPEHGVALVPADSLSSKE